MSHIPENVIEHAVRCIIATRDMCGNEREAALDLLASDYGIRGDDAHKAYRIANFRANAEWNGWQKTAGVPDKYRMI